VIYVLTHEYSDRSAFSICGVTENREIAEAWAHGNDENNIYPVPSMDETKNWMTGFAGWNSMKNTQGEK
jgi:hypothetical protein